MRKKLLSLLVLLMTAATGAWAQEVNYDINVIFSPYYNPMETHFNCMIINLTMGPEAEIKGTLELFVDGDLKGSFDVNGVMVDGSITPAIDAGDHNYSAVFKPEGGGEYYGNGSFTIDKVYTDINYYGSTSINLGVGESTEVGAYLNPMGAGELSYSSSDASVASITKKDDYTYIIQANAAGTATITFSFAGNTNYDAADNKTITVTVEPAGPTVVISGNCGDPEVHDGADVTYSLTDDGVLTISGTGAMANYDSYTSTPWFSVNSTITSVVIGDGVTTIGDNAFGNCTNMTSVSIPASVTSIGCAAFSSCGLSATALTVTFAGGSLLTTIGFQAFSQAKLTSITLPASVTSIDKWAFDACYYLATITLNSNPFIEDIAFPDGATVTMNLPANLADSARWTTFYNQNYRFQADANTQVFKVQLSGTTLTMHEVTDKITQEMSGYVLKTTGDGNPVMTKTTSTTSDSFSSYLEGVAVPPGTTSDGNMYVLNNGSQGVGFYKLTSGKKLGVGKAYLRPNGSAPEFFGFNENTTAINEHESHKSHELSGEYYDLQGRKIANSQKPKAKGLYIVNGKKMVLH